MASEGELEWDLIDDIWMSYEVDPMQMIDIKDEMFKINGRKIISNFIEVWKTIKIKKYKTYECSNLGRVRHKFTKKYSSMLFKGERVRIAICNAKELVDIIIATTFLKNAKNYKYIRHKNKIIHDNRSENLEWCEFRFTAETESNEKLEWKDIPGYPNYICSEDGQIMNKTTGKIRTVNIQRFIKNGTKPRIQLYINGKEHGRDVHILVALAFKYHQKTKKRKEVNHIDGNIHNFHASNLEWCTHSENMKHAHKYIIKKHFSRPVLQFTKDKKELIARHYSIREANIFIGLKHDSSKISHACCGRKSSIVNNFHWEYDDNKKGYGKWKKLKGFSRYRIYESGHVYDTKRKKCVAISDTKPYKKCHLSADNGKKYNIRIHVLLAKVFLIHKKREGQNEVNHINTDTWDNSLHNLEWSTRKENMENPNTKAKTGKKVAKLDKKGNIVKVYNSVLEASKDCKIHNINISHAANGRQKTAGGYAWKFVQNDMKISKKPKKKSSKNIDKRNNIIEDDVIRRQDNIE